MQKKFFAGLIIAMIAFTGLFPARGIILPPPSKTITLAWSYPEVNPEIVFKVYGSTDLTAPISTWTVVTNVSTTSCVLPVQYDCQFFTVTASNTVTGLESTYAGN